jgi:ActR/RegA family two-component response regulator
MPGAEDRDDAQLDVTLLPPLTLEQRQRQRKSFGNGVAQITIHGTRTLAEVERQHITDVLAACEGNISEAARQLGIYRSSLQRRLRKYMRQGL